MDTIFAMSSGAPPAAIAIIRMSGPSALATAAAIAGTLPADRAVGLRALHDPRDGRLLDRALVLAFAGPRTATGEDLAELHVHGGRAVVAAVEAALAAMPGLRHAEPGEFTRRALANGVIDLTEAEGLGDLLIAETETARRAALLIAEGGLRAMVENWTGQLVAIAAQIEAQLDFSDEEDVPEAAVESLLAEIARIAGEVDAILLQPPVERLKDGLRVVLAGPPNSGKSTLLNAMAGRDVSIVSAIAGTTRDRIEAPVVRAGIAYVLTDTAGLAEACDDPIERIGIARAQSAIATADIVLWLGDNAPDGDAVWLHPRVDQHGRKAAPQGAIPISALTGAGIDAVWSALALRAAGMLPVEGTVVTNCRQRILLSRVCESLRLGGSDDLLLVAEDVRVALSAFDAIVGRGSVEDVLDSLFARFCVGK